MTYQIFSQTVDRKSAPADVTIADGLQWRRWRPSWTSATPNGVPRSPYAIWTLLHHLRVFGNRDFSIVLAYDAGRVVHRTCVFPPYFRFPFMEPADLQLGDIWTHPSYRGQGLARRALRSALVEGARDAPRRFWYLAHRDNLASRALAESLGFQVVATAERTTRFGCRVLGIYAFQQEAGPAGSGPLPRRAA